MNNKKLLFSISLTAFILLVFGAAQAKSKFVTIGTGGITGVYYPTGGAIAKMINRKKKEYGIQATVESTGGSVFNVNAVMHGDLEFGIVQSDRQYQAVKGLAEWRDKGKQEDLRAVFSIHPESVTLVAALDADINSIKDVKGKRINIGNPGSGQRQNAIDALRAVGLNVEQDISAESIKASESPSLLQDERIDAFFYTVGHPSGAIKEACSGTRKIRLVDIDGIDSLLEKSPYYAKTIIPREMYPGAQNTEDVRTFGVKATLVSSVQVSDDIVYAVTKEVFENLDEFKKLHPAFSRLTPKNMLEGLSAPLHPGAEKYFKEAGLMK
jgi:TRAP transporter TAXI family solute receptor